MMLCPSKQTVPEPARDLERAVRSYNMPAMKFRRPPTVLVLLLPSLLFLPGCVERLLQIRSEPPGAAVFVNGEPAGETPLDYPFEHYGTFEITLRSKDHASFHVLEPVAPPWYQYIPIDLVAETVAPWRIRDHRKLRYRLEPLRPLDGDARDREMKSILDRQRAAEAQIDDSVKAGSPPAAASPAP